VVEDDDEEDGSASYEDSEENNSDGDRSIIPTPAPSGTQHKGKEPARPSTFKSGKLHLCFFRFDDI
jgi:hypothetical protein